jgi:hypothetical protein
MPPLANIPSGKPLIPGFLPASNSPYETLDFRINSKRKIGYADTFDLTYQRQLSNNTLVEVGYVGNYAKKLYQGYALQQVPYMYTLGGQSFATAFSNIAKALRTNTGAALAGSCKPAPFPGCFDTTAVPNQPFVEAFLAGQCAGYTSCTQMVLIRSTKAFPNLGAFGDNLAGILSYNLTDFWQQYVNGGSDGNQVLDSYIIGSNGRSNYNAGFVSLHQTTSAGLNLTFNYTYSHAFDQLGQNQESLNEASDAFNLDRDYGSAQFDRRHAITTLVTYDLPFGGGKLYSSGSGVVNRIIGGWNVSGVWTYATGLPLDVINGAGCQEFGQGVVFGNCSAYFPIDGKYQKGSVHNNNGQLTAFSNANAINNDPLGGYSFFAAPDPTVYGRTGRGYYRSMNRWNLDFGVSKTTKITERVSTRFDCQMTNVFNHPMFSDPQIMTDISSGSFGRLNNQYNAPRFIQFGLRFDF